MMSRKASRHRGIEASSRGKAAEKTSADYADYADFFKRILKRKGGRRINSHRGTENAEKMIRG